MKNMKMYSTNLTESKEEKIVKTTHYCETFWT